MLDNVLFPCSQSYDTSTFKSYTWYVYFLLLWCVRVKCVIVLRWDDFEKNI